MPPVQEKKRVDMSDKRREAARIVEGTTSAPRLASSSVVSFPKRNKCLGNHCSLIVRKEKEDSFCQRD